MNKESTFYRFKFKKKIYKSRAGREWFTIFYVSIKLCQIVSWSIVINRFIVVQLWPQWQKWNLCIIVLFPCDLFPFPKQFGRSIDVLIDLFFDIMIRRIFKSPRGISIYNYNKCIQGSLNRFGSFYEQKLLLLLWIEDFSQRFTV